MFLTYIFVSIMLAMMKQIVIMSKFPANLKFLQNTYILDQNLSHSNFLKNLVRPALNCLKNSTGPSEQFQFSPKSISIYYCYQSLKGMDNFLWECITVHSALSLRFDANHLGPSLQMRSGTLLSILGYEERTGGQEASLAIKTVEPLMLNDANTYK